MNSIHLQISIWLVVLNEQRHAATLILSKRGRRRFRIEVRRGSKLRARMRCLTASDRL